MSPQPRAIRQTPRPNHPDIQGHFSRFNRSAQRARCASSHRQLRFSPEIGRNAPAACNQFQADSAGRDARQTPVKPPHALSGYRFHRSPPKSALTRTGIRKSLSRPADAPTPDIGQTATCPQILARDVTSQRPIRPSRPIPDRLRQHPAGFSIPASATAIQTPPSRAQSLSAINQAVAWFQCTFTASGSITSARSNHAWAVSNCRNSL